MQLTGRTILLTGGSAGIGLELAKALVARGNQVLITGRDAARLQAARVAVPQLHIFNSDVSEPASIDALHREVTQAFPALDTLINNAGIMRNIRLTEARELADLTRELDIDLAGPMRMIQRFLPHLQTQKSALIVNVTSGLAFVPFAVAPVYSAAKAGLRAYTRALRAQLQGSRVRVIELAPPATETHLLRGEFAAEMAGQKAMEVGALVKSALAGIEAGRLEIRPGLANVLKVMSRLAPEFIFNQLTRATLPKSARA